MITPELIEYLRKQKGKNIPRETIFSKLSNAGWHQEDIEEGFSKMAGLQKMSAPLPPKEILNQPPRLTIERPETVKEEFIPSLKPKEPPRETPIETPKGTPIPPIITPLSRNYNTAPLKIIETMSSIESKIKRKGVPKFIFWAFGVLALGVIVGGLIFASNKGMIDLPTITSKIPFEIPFLKPTSEAEPEAVASNKEIEEPIFQIDRYILKSQHEDELKQAEIESKDALLKANTNSLKTGIQIIYNSEKSYGKKANTSGDCVNPESGSLFSTLGHAKNVDTSYLATSLKTILDLTSNRGTCSSTAKVWAVSFPLFSEPANTLEAHYDLYYCVDSTGFAQQTIENTLISGDDVPGKLFIETSCQPPAVVNQ